jgi:hypothetical protein
MWGTSSAKLILTASLLTALTGLLGPRFRWLPILNWAFLLSLAVLVIAYTFFEGVENRRVMTVAGFAWILIFPAISVVEVTVGQIGGQIGIVEVIPRRMGTVLSILSVLALVFGLELKLSRTSRLARRLLLTLFILSASLSIVALVYAGGFSIKGIRDFLGQTSLTTYLVVLAVGFACLVTMLFFAAILGLDVHHLDKIGAEPALIFGISFGASLADLVVIVQGLTGLAEHYSFLENMAFGGIVCAAMSMLLMVFFGVVAARKGIRREGLAHFLLASGSALTVSCVALVLGGEVVGFWFKHIHH